MRSTRALGVACTSALALVPALASAQASSRAAPPAERASVLAQAGFPYVDCVCDGYGPATSLGVGLRAAFAHRVQPWLELAFAPTWLIGTGAVSSSSVTAHDRFLSLTASAAWVIAPGSPVEGRFGLGAGPYAQWGSPRNYSWTHSGALVRVFLGGALAVAPRWRVVLELGMETGRGTVHASGGYPSTYLDGASSFLARATADLGVEWAF